MLRLIAAISVTSLTALVGFYLLRIIKISNTPQHSSVLLLLFFFSFFLHWHSMFSDSGYFSEESYDHLIPTAWIPFLDATPENGCLQVRK